MTETVTGIAALGVDWRALLFQILNFAVLLGVLRAFAYRPIVAVLERRRQTIEESLQNAATIEATKTALAIEQQAVLAHAREQAEQIIAGSKQQAATIVAAAEAAARERAEQVAAQAEAKIEQEITAARADLRAEALGLIAAATEKIIDVQLDPKKDAALIQAAIREAAQ